MASSFEPAFQQVPAVSVPAADAAPAQPWFAMLDRGTGFAADPRFSGAAQQQLEQEEAEARADAVLADALADAERRGREAALAEMANEGAACAALKLALRRLDEEMQEELASRMAETVALLCEEALAPLALDREALQSRCVTAAGHVGEGIIDASLRLNPEDIALLDSDFASTWHIVPDPGLERGTVMFDTPEGAVRDGPGEWRAALQEALGLC
ncbi:hypothetical protein [Alteraurantiacibacter aquimixticola]|uniref:Flagellar assembly protein FliH/Type III secretion system HrpE domain-containing protein n=1 Tax=Alteraurantiacibacter aquimixticola TaxID=2489173 RepID=A0A4T3F934_9SPHN|nr:hypothetical protein [Alteraurantiacibacter aquimixticola]TIX51530.1 hypothetical protein E5222_03495 [Alteraurantiacibacter aquimixticola]